MLNRGCWNWTAFSQGSFCSKSLLLFCLYLHFSQNHRIVGVGRDLCGSSSPTLLPKQGHLQQAAQDLVQAGLGYLQRRRLHSFPGQPVPVLWHPQREEVPPHVQTDTLPCAQWLPLLLVIVNMKAQQLSVVHRYQVFLGFRTFSLSLKLWSLHDIHMFFSTKEKFWPYLFERRTGIIVF